MSTSDPQGRPIFDPVDTTFNRNETTAQDDVASPSLSSSNALARFEFEPGRGREGTKVLMVEWDEDEATRDLQDDWELSWEGKKTVLPAREQASGDPGDDFAVNRLYFLLGPGVSMPTTVRLQKGSVVWKTNPLPAIFSPELGAVAREEGRKGILHTIWAKKRLRVLQSEIENESKNNAEGVGLEMCTAEVEWIEKNFGVQARSPNTSSARSPGGERVTEKLRGLQVGTRVRDLGSKRDMPAPAHNPLSPEASDVAVGSFGSFAAIKGMPSPSSLAAKPSQSTAQRRLSPQVPPEPFVAQRRQHAGMGSLNAPPEDMSRPATVQTSNDDSDDLFALPVRRQLKGSPKRV